MSKRGMNLLSMVCLVQMSDSSEIPINMELSFLKPVNKDPIGVVPNHWRRMYLIADSMFEQRETGDIWYDQIVQANRHAIFEAFSNSLLDNMPKLKRGRMLICVDWTVFSITKREDDRLDQVYSKLLTGSLIDQIIYLETLQ